MANHVEQPYFILYDQKNTKLFVGTLRQIQRRFQHVWGALPKSILVLRAVELGYHIEPIENTTTPAYTTYMPELKEKIKDLPHQPGVYLFKDKNGGVLYVGKAKDLRNRVQQYFGHDNRPQLPFLMAEATEVDYVVVQTELESLFLENTLIKQYLPAYNIKLRDDKNYAFIKIDYSTDIPSIGYGRKVENDHKTATYFGPYSSTRKIKQMLDLVRKIFPYCSNTKLGKRPCFYYFLHRCPGVCVGQISLEEYRKHIEQITLFLSGKYEQVTKELRRSMHAAAHAHQFEQAARFRDQLQSLEVLDEKQITIFPSKVNWDFISLAPDQTTSCTNLFKIRNGKLLDKENFLFDHSANPAVLEKFLETYYADTSDIPRAIYIETLIDNPGLIEDLLRLRTTHKVPIEVPSRGKKLQLIKLGHTNAAEYLRKWQTSQATNLDSITATLEGLRELLKLPTLPRRIEGYDISNIQGTNPVGSMVVVKDGITAKSEYRKFKINVKDTPDDFAMMREMLGRRLSHSRNSGQTSSSTNGRSQMNNQPETWPTPDLLVIDGGKGQLGVAVSVLKEKNVQIPVIGLAKRIEEIFLPGKSEPIVLGHDNPILQLLQRLRDEAHRFAITFHRSLREKHAVKSALDDIVGIGPKTKKLLKTKFGTISAIKNTSLEDLAKVIGQQKAELLKRFL
jgi:excinuclease ABC subunit C